MDGLLLFIARYISLKNVQSLQFLIGNRSVKIKRVTFDKGAGLVMITNVGYCQCWGLETIIFGFGSYLAVVTDQDPAWRVISDKGPENGEKTLQVVSNPYLVLVTDPWSSNICENFSWNCFSWGRNLKTTFIIVLWKIQLFKLKIVTILINTAFFFQEAWSSGSYFSGNSGSRSYRSGKYKSGSWSVKSFGSGSATLLLIFCCGAGGQFDPWFRRNFVIYIFLLPVGTYWHHQ